MVDKYKLSEGTLMNIMKGAVLNDCIMQVLGSKRITTKSEKERYRLLLSDGKYIISYAMLSTQVGASNSIGEIPIFSIIKINKYITSLINNTGKSDKKVLVILELDLLVSGDEVGEKIGNPEQLPDDKEIASTGSTTTTQNSMYTPKSIASINNGPVIKPAVSQNGHSSIDNQLIHPINSLSPYQNRWVIRAKVQLKSPMRTWSNSKSEGKLFSFDLVDETGEIRVTAFRDTAEKFYDIIEVDKVYFLSRASIKVANKQFNTLKNDYEMTLNNESVIQECMDVVDSIPETKYEFLAIDKLAQIEPGTIVDVIGVCKEATDVVTFQAKSTGRELKKRTLTLVDESLNSIELTLWGTQAETFDATSHPVIVLKGAKVGEFGGGKNISALQSTIMKVNPDLPEAHRLKGWFDNDGINSNTTSISSRTGTGSVSTKWLSFRDVIREGLGNSEKGDYYQCVATILLVRSENCVYKACPSENCNKKVVDMENGMYRCEKCNREYPNFKYRLLTSMNLADWSGNQWVNVFANEAEQILGATSDEIGQAADDELARIIEAANFKTFSFRLRAKMETYNDETRLKTVVMKVDPVNHGQYNACLLSKMDNAI